MLDPFGGREWDGQILAHERGAHHGHPYGLSGQVARQEERGGARTLCVPQLKRDECSNAARWQRT
jgi:hypothetical protein